MAIGLIIIGDEILSGKRTDKHFAKVLELLAARGLQLGWAEYIGDDRTRITATLQRSFDSDDIVFSCGGIGATPDDHTRQCAAAALGVGLVLHPEAKVRITQRVTELAEQGGTRLDLNASLKMGEFPLGAGIIPNPFNNVPGFSMRGDGDAGHYFVPGFPVMAHPMIEWVLDTYYSHLFHQVAWQEKSVLVFETAESTLTPMMEAIEAEFPLVKVFSLPSVGDAQTRRHIELGVKGEPEQVATAFARLQAGLDGFHAEYQTA
ncbi:MAG: molybdopterin-binding protein [Pseudomonadota bacterium]